MGVSAKHKPPAGDATPAPRVSRRTSYAVQIGRGEILQYVSVGKTEVGDGRMMARGAAERGRGELGEQDRRAGVADLAAVVE